MTPGDAVQTPLGKGVLREVRNAGRLLVEIRGRATEFAARDVTPLTGKAAQQALPRAGHGGAGTPGDEPIRSRESPAARPEIDLHGLTVEEALARTDDALNQALLAGLAELRVIHGRSGGRIRAALHRRLREIPSVRGFHVDPRNDGVTVVAF